MTNFEILVLCHFVLDWIFQTEWQATNKPKNWQALFNHVSIYTFGMALAFVYLGIPLIWSIWVFATHFLIDRRLIVPLIMKYIKGIDQKKIPESLFNILSITIDQILHLLVLAVVLS